MQHQILNINSLKEEKIGEEIIFENFYSSTDKTYISGTTSAFYQLIDGQTVHVENEQFGLSDNFKITVDKCKRQGWVDYMKKYVLLTCPISCDYESLITVDLNYILYEGKYIYEDVTVSIDGNGNTIFTPSSTFTLPIFGKVVYDKTKKYVRIPTRYYIDDNKISIDGIDYFDGVDFDFKNHLNKTNNMFYDYLYIDGISNVVSYYSSEDFKDILKCSLVIDSDNSNQIEVNNVYCATPYNYIVYNETECEVKQITDSEGLKDYIDVNTPLYYYKVLDGTVETFGTYSEALSSATFNNISSDQIFNKDVKVREFALASRKYPEYFYNDNISVGFEANYEKLLDGNFSGDTSLFNNLKITEKYTSSDYGEKLFILSNDSFSSEKGDEIFFVGKEEETRFVEVRQDANNENYILIDGVKYDEIPNTHYSIKINNNNYRVDINANISGASLTLDDGKVNVIPHFTSSNVLSSITQNIISGNDSVQQTYTDVTPLGSYIVDDNMYEVKIFKKINGDLSGNTTIYEYKAIEYNEKVKGRLIVEDVIGTNMFLCHPRTSIFGDTIKTQSAAENVCSLIYSNFNEMTFGFKNKIFGEIKTPEDFNLIRGDIDDINFIHIYNVNSYISIPLNITNKEAVNLFQEDVVDEYFTKEEEEDKLINDSADNERDVYYPAENVEGDSVCKLPINMHLCSELELNFHFRTRSGDKWDVIKDNGPDDFQTTGCSSYMIFDNPMYSGMTKETDYNNICNASDLLCFLGFTDNDVFYQKGKISKSFARLEFYDSPNPNNQSLLFYSTVFLDSGNLYKKYIYGMDDALNKYLTTNQILLENGTYKITSPEVRDSIRVNTEVSTGDTIGDNTKEIVSIINEDKRLSCRMDIKDKFNSATSSDGFYLYMFKDYSTEFYERSIYLKVEFNHAGYGKTIPMSYPRKFFCNNNEITSLTLNTALINNVEYDLVNPYTVKLSDGKEYVIDSQLEKSISKIKKGYQIKNSYYQEYIEIKVIYDSVNKKYCYYLPFDDNTCYDNGKMILNLFELKINNINGN